MREFSVVVINDLYEDWQGEVQLRIEQNGEVVSQQTKPCRVKALGREILDFKQDLPQKKGHYTLVAEIQRSGETVRSVRDIEMK